jgi:hypothetical protein
MQLRERDSRGKACTRQNDKLKRGNVVSLLKNRNLKKVTVKRVTEKYTLDEQLPEAKLELGHKTNTIRMLSDLSAPLYMHILTLELCKMIQLIRPHVKEKDRESIAYKAYQVIKEIRRTRPKWVFHQNPRAEYSFEKKSLTDGQVYDRELLKIKNCRNTCGIINKINVNQSFSQNRHVFEELEQMQSVNQEKAPRWVFAYKIPPLPIIKDIDTYLK